MMMKQPPIIFFFGDFDAFSGIINLSKDMKCFLPHKNKQENKYVSRLGGKKKIRSSVQS